MSRFLESGAARNLEDSFPRVLESGAAGGPLSITANGTGVSDGTAAVTQKLVVTASGTGAFGGSVAFGALPVTASGFGVFTGSVAFTAIRMTASGTGLFDGTAAMISKLVVTAGGTGVSTGSAAISNGRPLNAAGTGLFTGSAAIAIGSGPISHQLSGSGSGQSGGGAALISKLVASGSGTGLSGGNAALTSKMPMSTSGTGLLGGGAAVTSRMVMRGIGTTGLFGGHADVLVGGEQAISASGTGHFGGHASIMIPIDIVDLDVDIGALRAIDRITIGPMRSPLAVADFDVPTLEVGPLTSHSPVTVDPELVNGSAVTVGAL